MFGAMKKIHFLADRRSMAQTVVKQYIERYTQTAIEEADVCVVLGGDGFMLHSLHQYLSYNKPFYGLNFGRVGFLLNTSSETDLLERLNASQKTTLHPLRMEARTLSGETHTAVAINEISLLRQTHQAAKIEIIIDGACRINELVADGVLLATPAGSTAYNASIQGPILPLGCHLLALSPISPFRPRRWRGALLKNTTQVMFKIHDGKNRPVSATADSTEIRSIDWVRMYEDPKTPIHLLFDSHHQLEERIFLEQFQ